MGRGGEEMSKDNWVRKSLNRDEARESLNRDNEREKIEPESSQEDQKENQDD